MPLCDYQPHPLRFVWTFLAAGLVRSHTHAVCSGRSRLWLRFFAGSAAADLLSFGVFENAVAPALLDVSSVVRAWLLCLACGFCIRSVVAQQCSRHGLSPCARPLPMLCSIPRAASPHFSQLRLPRVAAVVAERGRITYCSPRPRWGCTRRPRCPPLSSSSSRCCFSSKSCRWHRAEPWLTIVCTSQITVPQRPRDQMLGVDAPCEDDRRESPRPGGDLSSSEDVCGPPLHRSAARHSTQPAIVGTSPPSSLAPSSHHCVRLACNWAGHPWDATAMATAAAKAEAAAGGRTTVL